MPSDSKTTHWSTPRIAVVLCLLTINVTGLTVLTRTAIAAMQSDVAHQSALVVTRLKAIVGSLRQ